MSWPQVRLSEISEHIRNGASIKQDSAAGGLPITRIETISERTVNLEKCGYAGLSESDYPGCKLEKGDILISHINSEKHLGKCAIFELDEYVVHGMNLLALRPKADRVFPKYLYYYLSSNEFLNKIPRITKKSVNQASFTVNNFKELEAPLPPLKEQQRIADILDKADAIRRKRQQAITLADEFLRSVFLDMFGDPVTNPKGWETRRLIELIDSDRPITYGILKPGDDVEDGVPYVRVVDMKDGVVLVGNLRKTTSEIAKQYRRSTLKSEDVLLSIRGHVGRLAIVPPELDGANITQDTARLAANNLCLPLYLYACLETTGMQKEMQRYVRGAAVKGINLGDVKQLRIPVPPIEMQRSIENRTTLMLSTIRKMEVSEFRMEENVKALTQDSFC
ncbi:restriction endonuclease subunit S [Microbulbifer sp.]|uniref:restriction endonuclease subunit S n=1 Tax=Microbulbifer sp. TaxID=1908541 RepID=UPI003F33CF47